MKLLNNPWIFSFSLVQDTVGAGASRVRQDRRVAFPVDPPVPARAALPLVDHARRLYLDVTVHPASSIDGVSRGRYRKRVRGRFIYIYHALYTRSRVH